MRIWSLLTAFILTCGMALASGKVDFSRYEAILSRKPFGEPPAEPGVATQVVVNPATSFVKDIRMCAITETPEFGIRVGFVDIVAKKNYYLRVGDAEDGIQLVDADYEKEGALLRKGPEEFWIYMDGRSSGVTAPPPVSVEVTSGPRLARESRGSYAERLRKRREASVKQEQPMPVVPPAGSVPQQKLTGEALEKHLKEYQMEAIRQGMPPLPVPLTKEMDDQLVAEGVLPPADSLGENPGAAPPAANGQPPEAMPGDDSSQ